MQGGVYRVLLPLFVHEKRKPLLIMAPERKYKRQANYDTTLGLIVTSRHETNRIFYSAVYLYCQTFGGEVDGSAP